MLLRSLAHETQKCTQLRTLPKHELCLISDSNHKELTVAELTTTLLLSLNAFLNGIFSLRFFY